MGASAFASLTLQVVNDDCTDFVSLGPGKESRLTHPLWSEGTCWGGTGERTDQFPWVVEVFRSGRPRHDPCAREGGSMATGRSLIDVAFSHGTLAINHPAPHAFTDGDVALLTHLAAVVSDGFQRFLELVRRRQTERLATVAAAVQRVRNQVLLMESQDDWVAVGEQLRRELHELLDSHQCNGSASHGRHAVRPHEDQPGEPAHAAAV